MGAPTEDPRATEARARVGSTIRGKYRLDEVLGSGGMATVYAATHRNKKRFAVKILHADQARPGDLRQRFIREGYLANSVGHPNAVAVLDDDVADDGSPFLVMELLEGSSLDRIWDRGGHRAPMRAALAIADQVLDVLAAAHAKGLVHRDIKPANLFVTTDGVVKVLDFGIARLTAGVDEEGGPQSTMNGFLVGTPAFMAPEQALGRTAEVDGRTDLWSVGALLFALISGRTVHEGASGPEIVVKAGSTPPRSLGLVTPDVPAAILAVVDRALAFEKTHRWESASAMRAALRQAHVEVFGSAPSGTAIAEALGRASIGKTAHAAALASTAASDPRLADGVGDSVATKLSPLTTGGPLSRGTVRPSAWPARKTAWGAAGAALLVAGTIAAFVPANVGPARPNDAVTVDAAAPSRPLAITDLPVPPTRNPDAATAYRRALQSYRDGSLRDALDEMVHATELDAEMAAAQLRSAIWDAISVNPYGERDRFARALALRTSLDARDREIVRAFEPLFASPPDLPRWRRELTALAALHTGDAEILFYEAAARTVTMRMTADEREWRAVLDADPDFGMVWNSIAGAQLMMGQFEAAEASATRCLHLNSTSLSCLRLRGEARQQLGRCSAMEEDARAAIQFHPSKSIGYLDLAEALAAQGDPDDAIVRLLDRAAGAAKGEGSRWSLKVPLERDVKLALARGRFVEALQRANALGTQAELEPLAESGTLALTRMDALDEMGLSGRASEVAAGLWRERNVRRHATFDNVFAPHLAPAVAGARLVREGRIGADELRTARLGWMTDLTDSGDPEPAWILVYVDGIETAAEAATARGALGDAEAPQSGAGEGAVTFSMAEFAMLEGRVADARVPLELLTRSCTALVRPIEQTRAFELLGEVDEEQGDRDAACSAYRTVLSRWGNAKPRSVTADKARARAKGLGCSP